MDRFEELRTFTKIVEAGSLSEAAERLRIAKSAVSRRLSDLETRLEARLVNRSTRALSLTEAGRSFYVRASGILTDLGEAEASVADKEPSPILTGKLRITAPLSFGVLHLADVVNDFMEAHPGLQVDLDLTDRTVDVIEEAFDVAIRAGELDDSRLVARKLATTQRVACASPSYLERLGIPKRPQDLRDDGHIGLTSRNISEPTYWTFVDAKGAKTTAHPIAQYHANNGDVIRSAALRGLGICALPTFITWRDLAEGRLVPILRDYTFPPRAIYGVYPEGRHLPHRVRRFIDFTAESLAKTPEWQMELTAGSSVMS